MNQNFIFDYENDLKEDKLEKNINSNVFEAMLKKHDAQLNNIKKMIKKQKNSSNL
jgi:hypothetical protein